MNKKRQLPMVLVRRWAGLLDRALWMFVVSFVLLCRPEGRVQDIYFEPGETVATGNILAADSFHFSGFGVGNLIGLDSTTPVGTYPIFSGQIDETGLFNIGRANEVYLGGGKWSFFQVDGNGLSYVVENGIEPAAEAYRRLGLGAVKPQGWILSQLLNDATTGMAGNFQYYRPTCGNSTWVTKNNNDGAGEISANWLDGFARMAYFSGDESAKTKADVFVQGVLDAQEADGYLGNFSTTNRYWRRGRELFNESRIEVALLAYYELTGRQEVLDAVVKAVNLTMSEYTPQNRPFTFMPGDPEFGDVSADRRLLNGHVLMFVDVCEWLHRLTGNLSYLTYAAFLYNEYSGSVDVSPDDLKTNTLMDASAPFTGHGAHVAEQLRVPLFLAYADGRAPYPVAASNAFQKLMRYIVPSGAMVSCESVEDLPPLPFQGYEYCATTELETSLASALQKAGAMEYGDMIERLVFNAAQGARLPDGTKIAYLSSATLPMALETMDLPYPNNSAGRWQYSPAHQVGGSCCSANAVKLMPHYVSSMWMKPAGEDGLAALLLGPSQVSTDVNGIAVTIVEETDYPFSDSITFRIIAEAPVAFPLHIRIPSWAGAVTLTANGAAVSATADMRILRKEWQTGDSVTVAFENPVKTSTCVNGEVSVNRGPLLYVLQWSAATNVLTKSRGGVPEFFEWELIPDVPKTSSGYFIEPTLPTGGFQAQARSDYDPGNPWAHPSTVLTGEMRTVKLDPNSRQPVTLWPIGSSLLRFAAFPTINIITTTATFDGGGGADGSWRTKENWTTDTVPMFNNTLEIYYTSGGTSWIGSQSTIRSLNFTADVDTSLNLRNLVNGSIGAQSLIFGGDGGAAITVAPGATGNIAIGQGANGGPISLAEDLTIIHNGSGTLSFNKRVAGAGGMIKNGTGTMILNSTTNNYVGMTMLNAGTTVGAVNYAFGGSANIVVADGATLTLGATNCISDQAGLALGITSTLNLNFIGADTIGSLSLDSGATFLSNGTYDAAALGALGAGTYTGSGNLAVAGVASDPAGTPYGWLLQYGLTNYDTDAMADVDGDGLLSWQEYVAGTDPTDPA
ncbi:MAG: glycoside hydrolase family 127 protein, partial [Kiritimatiellales bacterium]|nr:glycoside hydrolase family 127 protein [Kiritimatiellales bacterium]